MYTTEIITNPEPDVIKVANSIGGTKYIYHNQEVKKPIGIDKWVVSLFSGAGGLDIGLEQAGFKTAACVEYDADCRETLRFNRPDWKLFESDSYTLSGKTMKRVPGDIRDIDCAELLEFTGLEKGKISLVVGGAPCQPFSNIGKKLGKEDEKNGDLFQEFVRACLNFFYPFSSF